MSTRSSSTRRPWLLVLPAALLAAMAWLTWTLLVAPSSTRGPTDAEEEVATPPSDTPPVAPVDPETPAADRQLEQRTTSDRARRAVTLRGRLWDAEGRPVDGLVTLQSAHPVEALQEPSRSQRTQDGWYRIPELRPGVWKVSVRPGAEYLRGQGTLDLTDGRTERRADFVLRESIRFPVRIVDADGESLMQKGQFPSGIDLARHLTILASNRMPEGDLPLLTYARASDLDAGRFQRVSQRSPDRIKAEFGTMTLTVDPPVVLIAAFKHKVLATHLVQERDPGTVTMTVPLEDILACRCSVRFRVVSARTGLPPEQATADLSDRQSGRPRAADENGGFHYENDLPGHLELRIRAAGHAPSLRMVAVEAGEDLDLGTITLEEECPISGRVVTDALGGLEEAVLVAADLDHLPAHETPVTNYLQLVHEDGTFQVMAGRGRWALYLRDVPGQVDNGLLVDARAGPVNGLEVVAQRGTQVRVELAPTKDSQRLSWRMDDRLGVPVIASSVMTLLPGTYQLTVFDGTTPLFRHEVEVGRSPLHVRIDAQEGKLKALQGPQTEEWSGFVAVRLDEEAAVFDEATPALTVDLTGQVRDVSGLALPEATVTLWVAEGKQRRNRDRGSHWFSFPAVVPGDVTVEVTADGYRPFQQAWTLAPDPTLQNRDITLVPSICTRVRVVTPAGEPFGKGEGGTIRMTRLRLKVQSLERTPAGSSDSKVTPLNRFRASSWDVEVFGDLPVRLELFGEDQEEPLLTKECSELPAELLLVLDPASLEARQCDVRVLVTDGSTGEVLLPDSVRLMAPNSYGGGGKSELETAADGAVILRNQASGRRGLEVFLAGHDSVRRQVELEPGRQNDLGTVPLYAQARLVFRVIDPQGTPLAASLSLKPSGMDGDEATHHGLGADGRFDRTLGRRYWEALVRADGYAPLRQTFDLSGGDREAADVVLRVGTLVTWTGAWPLGDTRGIQVHEAGVTVQSMNLRGQESKTTHLLPGRYRVVLWRGSTAVHEEDLEVAGVTQAVRLSVD